MDLGVAKESQIPFYQPMQLQDIENMVEVSSESSNESFGKAQRRAEREIDKSIEHLRKKKNDEEFQRLMKEALFRKKNKRFSSRQVTGPQPGVEVDASEFSTAEDRVIEVHN